MHQEPALPTVPLACLYPLDERYLWEVESYANDDNVLEDRRHCVVEDGVELLFKDEYEDEENNNNKVILIINHRRIGLNIYIQAPPLFHQIYPCHCSSRHYQHLSNHSAWVGLSMKATCNRMPIGSRGLNPRPSFPLQILRHQRYSTDSGGSSSNLCLCHNLAPYLLFWRDR